MRAELDGDGNTEGGEDKKKQFLEQLFVKDSHDCVDDDKVIRFAGATVHGERVADILNCRRSNAPRYLKISGLVKKSTGGSDCINSQQKSAVTCVKHVFDCSVI